MARQRRTDNQRQRGWEMAASSKEGRASKVKGAVPDNPAQSNPDKQTGQNSNDAGYHVEVKAEKQPMPKGLEEVLNMLSKSLR